MPWKFDAQNVDLVFVQISTQQIVSGSIEFGDEIDGDLIIDTGERTNTLSIIDNGLRVIDGSI